MQAISISPAEVEKLFAITEGHFADFKSKEIAPGKLTRSVSAFANADGGELFVGVEEPSAGGPKTWNGFGSIEAANGLVQAVTSVLPLGQGCRMTFISTENQKGLLLQIEVFKSRDIIKTTAGDVYVRRSAQNLPVVQSDALERLRLNKGLASFETMTVDAPEDVVTNSLETIGFILEIVPHQEPEKWLRKQNLIVGNKPTVAGTVLFADEPQALLPKRCGIKIYRYRTADEEGTREALDGIPMTIEGCAYRWGIHLAPLELRYTGWTSRYYRRFPERTTPEPGMISWTGSPRTRLAMRIWSNCAGRKDLFARRVRSWRPPIGPVVRG